MKKTSLIFGMVVILGFGVHSKAYAHEGQSYQIIPKWSAETKHKEGQNSHLWIVNRSIDILEYDYRLVQRWQVEIIKQWKYELEQGLYQADYKNPYFDNYTFSSHFYDPDTKETYIPLAKQANETGVKYFKLAGEYYKQKRMADAFFHLGLSLHYLGDVLQPMHAANFTNLSFPQGFHSKYENFVDSIKDQYRVEDGKGYWNWKGHDPAEWMQAAAVYSKQDFTDIVNQDTKEWFLKASFSQQYANQWREAVTPVTGKRLIEAQRITAGYIKLWLNTYVNDNYGNAD
ncbi:phospholipase C [Bacillus cereus group sp. BfR-BA-01349]|uniref:phospholipase C n=1 Tax=Bacillus cereus group sp. BfR-BA-01349 TaxID=2920312 RepID=UPI001F582DA8